MTTSTEPGLLDGATDVTPGTGLAIRDGVYELPAKADTEEVAAWRALGAEVDDGSEAFVGYFGLKMPRLKFDARPGKGFVDDLTSVSHNEIVGIIQAIPPSRSWWEKDLDETGGGQQPDCASTVNFKARKPDPGVAKPQSTSCTTCEHSRWTVGPDARHPKAAADERVPPICGEVINMLIYRLADDTYYWTRFRSTAIKPVVDYISQLSRAGKAHYGVVTRITSEEVKKGLFEWIVPKFERIADLTPLDPGYRPIREITKQAMVSFKAVAEEMAASDAIDAGSRDMDETFPDTYQATTVDGDGAPF